MDFRGWLQDNPGICLSVLAGVTALAVAIEIISLKQRRKALRALAASWGMTYSPTDRLRLLVRIADQFPVPGAADLDVTDVIYGSGGDYYRYIFTVRYTVGIIRGKRAMQRVATFSEARRGILPGSSASITMANEGPSLIEQYRSLDPTASTKKNSAP